MSDDKKKRDCPQSFIEVGAASVVSRHALFDLSPMFQNLREALKAAEPDMKRLGIARMELAPGELLLAEAEQAATKLMAAHDSWRAMLERHNIETPTDAQILDCHKKQGVKAAEGSSLKAAVTLGNYR